MIINLFIIISILVLWFNTDAFIEYVKLFKLPFFKVNQYMLYKEEKDCSVDYHTYLLLKHNNFFVRLITCPICLTFWLTLLICGFSGVAILNFPFIFICSLILYYVFNKVST